MIRKSNQKTFLDIYNSAETMINDLDTNYSILRPSNSTDDYLTLAFYLIAGKYGDTPINGYDDEARWKLRLFTIMRDGEPIWQFKNDLKEQVLNMSIDDIMKGDLSIYNTALNPNTDPSDTDTKELEYINSQNTARRTLNKSQAIALKSDMLDAFHDIDDIFLRPFEKLFSKFTLQDIPLYIYTDNNEDD